MPHSSNLRFFWDSHPISHQNTCVKWQLLLVYWHATSVDNYRGAYNAIHIMACASQCLGSQALGASFPLCPGTNKFDFAWEHVYALCKWTSHSLLLFLIMACLRVCMCVRAHAHAHAHMRSEKEPYQGIVTKTFFYIPTNLPCKLLLYFLFTLLLIACFLASLGFCLFLKYCLIRVYFLLFLVKILIRLFSMHLFNQSM